MNTKTKFIADLATVIANENSYQELRRQCWSRAKGFFPRKDSGDLDLIVDEVMDKVLEVWWKRQPEEPFGPYMYKTEVNELRSMIRRQRNKRQIPLEPLENVLGSYDEPCMDDEPSTEDMMTAIENLTASMFKGKEKIVWEGLWNHKSKQEIMIEAHMNGNSFDKCKSVVIKKVRARLKEAQRDI